MLNCNCLLSWNDHTSVPSSLSRKNEVTSGITVDSGLYGLGSDFRIDFTFTVCSSCLANLSSVLVLNGQPGEGDIPGSKQTNDDFETLRIDDKPGVERM